MKKIIYILLFISAVAEAQQLDGFEITLPGDPGSALSADLDGDNIKDLALIIAKEDYSESVLILWGDKKNQFISKTEIPTGITNKEINGYPLHYPSMRDTSSRTILSDDFNADKKMDVATSRGIFINLGSRKFQFNQFKIGTACLPKAIGQLKNKDIIVQSAEGIRACNLKKCAVLIRSKVIENAHLFNSDLLVLDFDQDGQLDILTGSKYDDSYNSYVWLGKNKFKKSPIKLEGVSPVDIQVFDLNHDGRSDFISQNPEFIPDFPSNSALSINNITGVTPLMTFTNFDNHNDNSTVVPNSEGCFDYYQIGVDAGFGVLKTKMNSSKQCVPDIETNPFSILGDIVGTGIQCLDLGAKKCSLIIRRSYIPNHSQGRLWIQKL